MGYYKLLSYCRKQRKQQLGKIIVVATTTTTQVTTIFGCIVANIIYCTKQFIFVCVVVVIIIIIAISTTRITTCALTPVKIQLPQASRATYRTRHQSNSRFVPSFEWMDRNQKSNDNDNNVYNKMKNIDSDDNSIPQYHTLSNIRRIFCLSDLHTDHGANMNWLHDTINNNSNNNNHSNSSTGCDLQSNDLVIVAGDISHDIVTFQQTIQLLRSKCHVFFVPGNHEAWLDKNEMTNHDNNNDNNDHNNDNNNNKNNHNTKVRNSIEKLLFIQKICRDCNCYVDPIYIRGKNPIWIVPLQSWYDGTLSFDETLCTGFEVWPWVDFTRCIWPSTQFPLHDTTSCNARIPIGLTKYYHNMNIRSLQYIQSNIIQQHQQQQEEETNTKKQSIGIITVSHFLPNQQCLPDWKIINAPSFDTDTWLDHGAGSTSAKFAKVAGTKLLDEQIRSIDNFFCLKTTTATATATATIDSSTATETTETTETAKTTQLPTTTRTRTTPIIPTKQENEEKEQRVTYDSIRQIHIFGHSHRPKDFEYNGIRYIHNPLGKPRERHFNMISANVQFKLIWDIQENTQDGSGGGGGEFASGEVPSPTIIRYWEENEQEEEEGLM